MTQGKYFIVHGAEDLEQHPNVLGLLVRVDKKGKPLRDRRGSFLPVSNWTKNVKLGDRVVYYTRGDHMIKGIFEVASKELDKKDGRRVKEWKRGLIQFMIRPILRPDKGVDLRTLIPKLNLFSHLKIPDIDYRMAIAGKNYIRSLEPHDFDIIEKALQSSEKSKPIKKLTIYDKNQTITRKYGPYGEGLEHKKLKEFIATHPESIGLTNVKKVEIEHIFISGDAVDILFEIRENKYVVVEIETDYPLPGSYQALKYRVLKCAEMDKNINSSDVEAVLVAKIIPPEVQSICSKYGIRPVLIQN
jgi:hypothetical protein